MLRFPGQEDDEDVDMMGDYSGGSSVPSSPGSTQAVLESGLIHGLRATPPLPPPADFTANNTHSPSPSRKRRRDPPGQLDFGGDEEEEDEDEDEEEEEDEDEEMIENV